MRFIINILNCTDSIEVFIDGVQAINQKNTFICDVTEGVHDVRIVRNSQLENISLKDIIYDWASALLGVADWTVGTKKFSANQCILEMKVNVFNNIEIDIDTTHKGFELVKEYESVLNIDKKFLVSEKMRKKERNIYIVPILILAAILELCFLIVFVLSLIGEKFKAALGVFAIVVFWAWLIYSNVIKKM